MSSERRVGVLLVGPLSRESGRVPFDVRHQVPRVRKELGHIRRRERGEGIAGMLLVGDDDVKYVPENFIVCYQNHEAAQELRPRPR